MYSSSFLKFYIIIDCCESKLRVLTVEFVYFSQNESTIFLVQNVQFAFSQVLHHY